MPKPRRSFGRRHVGRQTLLTRVTAPLNIGVLLNEAVLRARSAAQGSWLASCANWLMPFCCPT